MTRQLPRQVRQPKRGNTQGPNVLEGVETVEEAGGDQVPEVLVGQGVSLLPAGDVEAGDGDDGGEEQGGRLPDRQQRTGLVDGGVEEVPGQGGLEQGEHVLGLFDAEKAQRDHVVFHVLLGVAAGGCPVLQPAPQRRELGDLVQGSHGSRGHLRGRVLRVDGAGWFPGVFAGGL